METALKNDTFANRVLRDMSSGVIVLDTSGKIVYCNKPASDMLEIPNGYEKVSIGVSEQFSENKDNDEFLEFILQSIYKKDEAHVGSCRYVSPSGKNYIFKMTNSFLAAEGDAPSQIVITMEDETEEEELKVKLKDSSSTFSIVLIGMCFWLIFFAVWLYTGKPFHRKYLTKGIDLLGLIIFIFILCCTSLKLKDIGIKPVKFKETILTSLVIVAVLVALMAATKLVLMKVNPGMFKPGKPFIDFSRFTMHYVEYVSTALLQEFLARGGIQSNLKRLTAAKHKSLMAIFMASLLFAVLHIHLGLVYMIGAAILSAVLGILYNKQENLVGVWMVHYSFGVFGALFNLI